MATHNDVDLPTLNGYTELLDATLAYKGYQVLTASNGREGLDRLAQQSVDLVICDVMMPVMDGREFCRAARADAQHQHIPIVLMSAARESFLGADCQHSAFVGKPFDLDMVLATVEQLIGPPSGTTPA